MAEADAYAAIDYADWAVENARVAILDAIDARIYADDKAALLVYRRVSGLGSGIARAQLLCVRLATPELARVVRPSPLAARRSVAVGAATFLG